TFLVAVADQYALENNSGNGPHLQLNGAAVVAGAFDGWTPVAAAQTASGYEVAWQLGNSFIIWNTDSNGNYLSQSGILSGASTGLEIAETVFQHDLNGDGTIGVTSTLIESNGTTSLVAVADQYALENSSGAGPHLQLNGAPVVAGQEGPWLPVAAAQTSTGYEVAWQDGNSFIIWNTDSNGNYLSQSGTLSGTSAALETYEVSFQHDLNGDGIIGVPPAGGATVVANATTAAVHSDNFSFQDLSAAETNNASYRSGAMNRAPAWHLDGFSFHQDHQGDGPVGVLPQPAPMQAHLDGFHQEPSGDGAHGGGGTHVEPPTAHWHFDLIA
ncbi:MAG: protease, partial [Bradyrhizobium sp.]